MIGRATEVETLLACRDAKRPHFVVVTGRRRVGKTYLVRQAFEDDFAFYTTGLARVGRRRQLEEFAEALRRHGLPHAAVPKDWFAAFRTLRDLLEASDRPKKVVFLDELPWMDTRRSEFLSALESFWNGWASARADILLVVCGSATSWVVGNLFLNTGGLHNRVTRRIHLQPFTLAECRALLEANGVLLGATDLLEAYMVFGGIPHYLDQLDRRQSLAQNIDRLCFADGAPLGDEFDQLYSSLFAQPENHVAVIRAVGQKRRGLARGEIIAATGISDGGGLTKVLDELERSGFLRRDRGFGKAERDGLYQLSDPFSDFALRFLRPGVADEAFWSGTDHSGARNAWRGYAFEQVCLAHLPQIKGKLGISGVATTTSSWLGQRDGQKAQIDLVLARRDGVINLCEMKFADREYEITKAYADRLRQQRWAFADHAPKSAALHTTLVTPYGVKRNIHWSEVQAEVTLDDLFA